MLKKEGTPKNFGDDFKKNRQKNSGINVQKITTLDISRRYIDKSNYFLGLKRLKNLFLGL